MWLQIIFSILLAVVAVRFIMYTSSHELVRVLQNREDFEVRYPRTYLWIAVVLYLVMVSVVLSLIIWQTADVLGIAAAGALGTAGTVFLLRALVWRIEVRDKYIIFVSPVGVKRLLHYEDVVSASVLPRKVEIHTILKTFRMSPRVIYLEDLLFMLSDHGVPIHRDDLEK